MTTTPSSKICPQCGAAFTRPIRYGYPVDRNRWMAKQFCNRTCANRYRKPYLRINLEDDAQETRKLRSQRSEVRQEQGECVRDMQLRNAAKTSREVKALGSHLQIKAPNLMLERDMLFDKYLRAYDNYQSWKTKQVQAYCTNYSHDHHKPMNMEAILKRHLEDISEQLRRYDDRINAATTSGPLFY